jgi:hypothetical protein
MAFCSTAAVLACARAIATPADSAVGTSSSSPLPSRTGAQLSSGNLTPSAAADTPPSGSLLRGGARAPATKVIASIGPASRDAATLDALLEAGMSCARLDASNARPLFWHLETYELLQARVRARAAARRRAPAAAFVGSAENPCSLALAFVLDDGGWAAARAAAPSREAGARRASSGAGARAASLSRELRRSRLLTRRVIFSVLRSFPPRVRARRRCSARGACAP